MPSVLCENEVDDVDVRSNQSEIYLSEKDAGIKEEIGSFVQQGLQF